MNDLKHNLFNISQLCDKSFNVKFLNNKCILNLYNKLVLEVVSINNINMINRRLCHASMKTLRKITYTKLFRDVHKLSYSNDHLCDVYIQGK